MQAEEIREVVVVFKSHFDIGFTAPTEEVLQFYADEMLTHALYSLDATTDRESGQFMWTLPAWPLREILRRCSPKNRICLEQYIYQDRVAWHALPFTSHVDFLGADDMLWGMEVARELCRTYNKPLRRTAKMTDVPGHGRMLAEFLALGGVEFLHLGCNQFATPPAVPELFWWEAPSGKRILVQYSKGGYGTGLLPPKDWCLPVWMVFIGARDNGLPPTPQEVDALHQKLAGIYPNAKIRSGTLEDAWALYRDVLTAELPVVTKDLADTWIHGVGTYPREVSVVRRLRQRMLRIEGAMFAQWPRLAQSERQELINRHSQARENMGLFGEHTWGLDVKTWLGPIPSYDASDFSAFLTTKPSLRMERSWDQQRAYARTAEQACMMMETQLNLKPARPMARTSVQVSAGTIQSKAWMITYKPETGVITGIYNKEQSAWIMRDERGVVQYRYDVYSAQDMTDYFRAFAYRFSDWGVNDCGRMKYPEEEHVTLTPVFLGTSQAEDNITFHYERASDAGPYGDAQRIDIVFRLPDTGPMPINVQLYNKAPTAFVESGHLCFGFAAQPPCRWRINKLGYVLDPARDIVRDANHAYYALEYFAALLTDDWVAMVETLDTPLVSLGESGVFRFTHEYQEHAPQMQFCLFNTMWGTNFPQWIQGDASFWFFLHAYDSQDEAGLYRHAVHTPETLPVTVSEGVQIVSLLPGKGKWMLYLHNLLNRTQEVSVRWEGVDLTFGDVKRGDDIRLSMRPYAYELLWCQRRDET